MDGLLLTGMVPAEYGAQVKRAELVLDGQASSRGTSDDNAVSGEEMDVDSRSEADDLLQLLNELGGLDNDETAPTPASLPRQTMPAAAMAPLSDDDMNLEAAVQRLFAGLNEPAVRDAPDAGEDPFAALAFSLRSFNTVPQLPEAAADAAAAPAAAAAHVLAADVPAEGTPLGTPADDSLLARKAAEAKKQLLVVSGSPTCAHNHWDNVRTKKGNVYLRCRVCDSQWRAPLAEIVKCEAFVEAQECPNGEACSKLHIYQKKQSLTHRVQLHGDGVLRRVMRCGLRLQQADAAVAQVGKMEGPVTARVLSGSDRARSPTAGPASHASGSSTNVSFNNTAGVSPSASSTDRGNTTGAARTATVMLERGEGSAIGMIVKGPLIVRVDEECPAGHAGLRPGMVIHRINGVTVAADTTTDQIITDLKRVWNVQARVSVTVKYEGPPPLPTGMPHSMLGQDAAGFAGAGGMDESALQGLMPGLLGNGLADPEYMARCLNLLAMQNMQLQQQLMMSQDGLQGMPMGVPLNNRY